MLRTYERECDRFELEGKLFLDIEGVELLLLLLLLSAGLWY